MQDEPIVNAQDIIHVAGKPLEFFEDNDDLVEKGFETSIQVVVIL